MSKLTVKRPDTIIKNRMADSNGHRCSVGLLAEAIGIDLSSFEDQDSSGEEYDQLKDDEVVHKVANFLGLPNDTVNDLVQRTDDAADDFQRMCIFDDFCSEHDIEITD